MIKTKQIFYQFRSDINNITSNFLKSLYRDYTNKIFKRKSTFHINSQQSDIHLQGVFLIGMVRQASSFQCKKLKNPVLKLELSDSAAAFNSKLLTSMNFNFQRLISAQGSTTFSPGSEFRPLVVLDPLLNSFHRWKKFKTIVY